MLRRFASWRNKNNSNRRLANTFNRSCSLSHSSGTSPKGRSPDFRLRFAAVARPTLPPIPSRWCSGLSALIGHLRCCSFSEAGGEVPRRVKDSLRHSVQPLPDLPRSQSLACADTGAPPYRMSLTPLPPEHLGFRPPSAKKRCSRFA